MLWTRCVVLLSVTALFCSEGASRQAAVPQSFTISGTVVEHGSNHPLKNTVVTIVAVAQEGAHASCRTGEDGRFTFTQLAAGKYQIHARLRGFPPQALAEDENYSTAIAAGPGLDSGNIVFPLFAGGSIRGTVLDEETEPIRQARVWLFRKGVFSGASHISLQGQQTTDSSGRFRFPYLKIGTYFVAVQAQPWYSQNNFTPPPSGAGQTNPNSEFDVSYPLTYYAGTADLASASALAVTEGSSKDVQITLRPVPSVHVHISGIPAESRNAFVPTFSQITFGGFQVPGFGGAFTGENQFELFGIAPGRYLVSASRQGRHPSEQFAPQVLDLTTNATIDLGAQASSSLGGRITFNGLAGPPSQASVALQRADGQGGLMISAATDGSLNLTRGALLPGRYQLRLVNAPDFYLKSIGAKGAAVSAGELEIPDAASVQLSLVAARGVTSINGTAMKDDKPFAGAMVLLIPKNFARTDFIRRDQSDSDGTFTLPNVPVGEYVLLAIDDGRELAYCEPAAMKPYLSGGTVITTPVPKGSAVTVNVLPRQPGSN